MNEHQYSTGIGDLKRLSFRRTVEQGETSAEATGASRLLFRTVVVVGVSALVTWASLSAILSHAYHTIPARH
ncbi:hypothetical protein DP57_6002 [Burkholderia pseudomallei]|uniref:hypothetical protein n=1 Tax=Burkholderia pseudomallei TaxID=28450 RepID=UPI00050ED99E|nr:hypothetical protein [Burkholderia pseudomallei]KGC70278.1 hypothetical protein DP57_6002 [Burkholderia pseudomallei]